MPSSHCVYYQAHILKSKCWFFTAIIRSAEHMAFDRTINNEENIFEFFVPPGMEQHFLEMMAYFVREGIASNLTKLPNRLLSADSVA